MERIYKNVAQLILSNRQLRFHNVGDPRSFWLDLSQRHTELDNQERAFICTMVAMQEHGPDMDIRWMLAPQMKSNWFASYQTYHKVRRKLEAKHVIMRDGNRHRFYLNPEFHPSFSKEWMAEVNRGVNTAIISLYNEQFSET